MPHCSLCNSDETDDLRYGKMLVKQRVSVHTFCLYLSSNLVQRGKDQSGICGFLIQDILAEVRRGLSLKCCYCGKRNASIGCCRQQCVKSFHLACGIRNGAVNQFVGTYKSFCDRHLPPMEIQPSTTETCVICLEPLMTESGFEPTKMIHSPCCNNGWYHKYCLQNYANTSGYFFKCPLCNCSKVFRDVMLWGIFIPNADAEWEKEPNAFRELLERDTDCIAVNCRKKLGRKSRIDDLIYCTSCGSKPMHPECFDDNISLQPDDYICDVCNIVFNKSTASIEPVIENSSNAELSLTNPDSSDDDDPLDTNLFKLHNRKNNAFRRPCAFISSDETDSDDPLTADWDLLKENSRNSINITTTETTKPKEQQQQQTNKRTIKDNNETESSIRQPLTSCITNIQASKHETQQNSNLRTASDEELVPEKKADISCIGRRLRKRQSCTNVNLQSGSTARANLRRSCTNLNAARSTSMSSDTDTDDDENEKEVLNPSQSKRRRKTVHHNADISCIANRVRRRRSQINPESKFHLATINENDINLAISKERTNTSPKRYSEPGRTHDCIAKRTTASATITSHNNQNNDFCSSFLRDLEQAAKNTTTPLEMNNLNQNKPNTHDISCIGTRVHRRRTQSMNLDSEDSSSSGHGRMRKSRGN